MKQKLFILLSLLMSTIAFGQTIWTGGGFNSDWNDTDNWSSSSVPTSSNDVVIPSGFTVTISTAVNVKSINLQGNSVLNINANFTFAEDSTFEAGTTINWNIGTISGNGKTLTNLGTIITSSSIVFIDSDTTISNEGSINLADIGDIFINTGGELNNTATGTIDFQSDGSGIGQSGAGINLLSNAGLIKTSFATADPTDQATIAAELKNNNGTIQVEKGTLNLANGTVNGIELTDGVYNVFANAALDFDSLVTISGILTGSIDGELNWRSSLYVNSPGTATFNFSGSETVSWISGSLLGDGTLINEGTIKTLANNIFINGTTTLTNNGNINLTGLGDIFISTDSVLNNSASGTIDFQADNSGIGQSGAGINLLSNSGLIKTSFTTADATDQATITVELKNNNGTIQVEEGILNLNNSTVNGIELTDGVYNVFANAALDFDSLVTLSGILTGTIDGQLNWRSDVYVNSPNNATFNFSGNETVSWVSGSLIGDGTLVNEGNINTLTNNVFIAGTSTLTNNGLINLTGSGDLLIGTGCVLNNTASGIIDFQSDGSGISQSGAGINLLNNSGLIKTSFSSNDPADQATISAELKNNDGTIQVEKGTLNLSNTTVNGIELTDGVYNVFANAALDFDGLVTLLGVLTGNLAGDLNWKGEVYVNSPNTATFNFSGNETVSWVSGSLLGDGTLINEGSIHTLINNVFINGTSTLTNNGLINLTGSGDLLIGTGCVLNNTVSGTIDFQADDSGISQSGSGINLLNNSGLIKTSFTTADAADQATITADLKNNNGTIQVEKGTLNLTNTTVNAIELTDGIYNVFANAALDFDGSVTISGMLSGNLTGDLNWRSNLYVNSPNTATFDFMGNETVSWVSGNLVGGGTLINESSINVFTNNVFINGATTLTNNGFINLTDSGDIFISTDCVLNNSATGTIVFLADGSGINESGAGTNLLNNSGLIQSSTLTGTATIGCEVNNSGIIEATSGTINFSGSLDHQLNGVLKGIASINLPAIANLTNNGIISPGLSTGTLTIIGNYTSTADTVLDIELNGLTPDTEHDVIAVTGTSVVFEGTVNVTMGFEGEIGDSFTIATTSGTIASGNLQSPIENVEFDGNSYTFDVSYPNNNSVVLTITDKTTLSLDDFDNTAYSVSLYPNPATSFIELDTNATISSYSIFDMLGKAIVTNQNYDSPTINVENLSNGLYFIKFNVKDASPITAKFVKK